MRKKVLFALGLCCVMIAGCSDGREYAQAKGEDAGIVSESVISTKTVKRVNTVMPLPAWYTDKAGNHMPDGEYPVSFRLKDLKKTVKGYALRMEFFDYDRYAVKDVKQLKKGDSIQVQHKMVKVESVTWNKDKEGTVTLVDINGGTEENGLSLLLDEEEYRTTSLDDYPLYYSIGKVTAAISRDMTCQDCYDYETLPDGIITGYEDLPGSITKSQLKYWTQSNTTVTIRNEEIVKIARRWTP